MLKSMVCMRMILLGAAVVVLASFLYGRYILNKMLDVQRNIIGALYETDAAQAEIYLHAMFAEVTEEHMKHGSIAMQTYGFTSRCNGPTFRSALPRRIP